MRIRKAAVVVVLGLMVSSRGGWANTGGGGTPPGPGPYVYGQQPASPLIIANPIRTDIIGTVTEVHDAPGYGFFSDVALNDTIGATLDITSAITGTNATLGWRS